MCGFVSVIFIEKQNGKKVKNGDFTENIVNFAMMFELFFTSRDVDKHSNAIITHTRVLAKIQDILVFVEIKHDYQEYNSEMQYIKCHKIHTSQIIEVILILV